MLCMQYQHRPLQRIELHRAADHRHTAVALVETYTDFTLTDHDAPVGALDGQCCPARHLECDLATHKGDSTCTQIDIHRAVGVQLQGAAIGQGQTFVLADGGLQVGTPDIQRQLTAHQPGGRDQCHSAQRSFERRASCFVRTIQSSHSQIGRQAEKTLPQLLRLLPGTLMTGRAVAPVLQHGVIFFAGTAGFQKRQPLRRPAYYLAFFVRRCRANHQSTSRQCS